MCKQREKRLMSSGQILNNSVQMILGWPSTKAVQKMVHENITTEKYADDQTIENNVNASNSVSTRLFYTCTPK